MAQLAFDNIARVLQGHPAITPATSD